MKIVVYRYKENNKIGNISKLTDRQWESLKGTNKLETYNQNKDNKDYATIYEIGVDELPKELLEYFVYSYCNRKQSALNDIYEKLITLEDTLYDLSSDISNVKDDIEEYMKDE